MEGMEETVENWAASESGSGMLITVACSTLAILLVTFIRKKICPLAILLAKFIWTKIGPLAIFLAKYVLKLSCALASLAAELVLKRIFQRTAPAHAAAATTGAESNVELHERDEGTGPGRAQGVDV